MLNGIGDAPHQIGGKVIKVDEDTRKIIYVDTDRVSCMGEWNDHPKVYYTIPPGGEAICRYCETKFRKKEDEPI